MKKNTNLKKTKNANHFYTFIYQRLLMLLLLCLSMLDIVSKKDMTDPQASYQKCYVGFPVFRRLALKNSGRVSTRFFAKTAHDAEGHKERNTQDQEKTDDVGDGVDEYKKEHNTATSENDHQGKQVDSTIVDTNADVEARDEICPNPYGDDSFATIDGICP